MSSLHLQSTGVQLTFVDGLGACVYISRQTVKLHAVRLSNLIKQAEEEDQFCVRCPCFPRELLNGVMVRIRLPVSDNTGYSTATFPVILCQGGNPKVGYI